MLLAYKAFKSLLMSVLHAQVTKSSILCIHIIISLTLYDLRFLVDVDLDEHDFELDIMASSSASVSVMHVSLS